MKGFSKVLMVIAVITLVVTLQTFWANAADKVYTLRAAHANAPVEDSVYQVEAEMFKKLVEQYSNGRIKVDIYPSAQLGSDAESVEFIKSGTLDIHLTSLNLITDHCPRLEALILPYIFPEKSQGVKAIDSLWDYFNEYTITRANIRLLDLPITGYRKLMTTKPIMNMEELRTLKFRLPPSPIMLKTFEAFGVKPTPIPWVELFNAMQLGTVNGFECDPSVLVSARFNEVVTYITDVDWMTQVSVMYMSETSYQKLPPELQEAVDKAARECREFMIEKADEILGRCIEASPKVEFLGRPDDYEEWISKGRSVWPEFYKRIGDGDADLGKEAIEKVVAASE